MSLFVNSQLNNKKFEEHFSKKYANRWEQLFKSLHQPERQILRPNGFIKKIKNNFYSTEFIKSEYLNNFEFRSVDFELEKNLDGFFENYIMDPASLFVALCLEVKPYEHVLDLCSAPGGKSLILAEKMWSEYSKENFDEENNKDALIEGSLTCNEISEPRRSRLLRVLQDYIPKPKRMFVQVKGWDANKYGLVMPNAFDKVLADVPCSGERHLLKNSTEFNLWTAKRSANLSIRQYSILSSAWLTTKTGGRIVYSTCSISDIENDEVLKKLVKKRSVEVIFPKWIDHLCFIEKTEFGYQILPDNGGFGPMYFSVINKI